MKIFLSSEERFALGQQQRKRIKRTEHGAWRAKLRGEAPLKLLQDSMHGRIPALAALKYKRMEASPFGYFRGAVSVMAYDLSLVGNTEILSQLCGDAHVRNLGAYAGPDGRLVFDINDFDETIVGPFEWDVKRMAASLILAGREAGSNDGRCREAAAKFLARYRRSMRTFAGMAVLEVARFQVHRLRENPAVERILEIAERAAPKDTVRALTTPEKSRHSKANHRVAGTLGKADRQKKDLRPRAARIFKNDPPVLERVTGADRQHAIGSLVEYAKTLSPERKVFFSQYSLIDVAFKVVGTGSVGLRDYCIYMVGNGSKDPLFLQIKEEVRSAYAPYVQHSRAKTRYQHTRNEGRRVVEGERLMQLQSDPFLGWTSFEGRDYLVRQLNDHKATVELKYLNQTGLIEYATVCGELLARGHARSGDSSMLAGYLGSSGNFDDAVTSFAEAYANQTERDWRELVKSRKAK